ncbi:hypothetical protein FGO68_gene11889 [Halteria grandinella]|uniref:Transmembrane protein n=1 Tax=Halteria grandinella TaxID=5974 RepID=A0A8J8NAP3_HALGN|nr:hypothetical protein FGO68_gene11889 [Halteria grandinella]
MMSSHDRQQSERTPATGSPDERAEIKQESAERCATEDVSSTAHREDRRGLGLRGAQSLYSVNWNAMTAIATIITGACAIIAIFMTTETLRITNSTFETARKAQISEALTYTLDRVPYITARWSGTDASIELRNVGQATGVVYSITISSANSQNTLVYPGNETTGNTLASLFMSAANSFDITMYGAMNHSVDIENPFLPLASGEARTIVHFKIPENYTNLSRHFLESIHTRICFTDLLGQMRATYDLLSTRSYQLPECPKPIRLIDISDVRLQFTLLKYLRILASMVRMALVFQFPESEWLCICSLATFET